SISRSKSSSSPGPSPGPSPVLSKSSLGPNPVQDLDQNLGLSYPFYLDDLILDDSPFLSILPSYPSFLFYPILPSHSIQVQVHVQVQVKSRSKSSPGPRSKSRSNSKFFLILRF
ncbi:unnamed protein product, partial [Owenia fusiformis]